MFKQFQILRALSAEFGQILYGPTESRPLKEDEFVIYVLKLEDDKYYVGRTKNPSVRLEDHFHSNGSSWTKKYKPIEVLETIRCCDVYDEDKYTLKYMNTYGINNVRGGTYVTVNLDDATIHQLTKMLNGANDRCFKCGKDGHFFKDCKGERGVCCYKCGRNGHYANMCYATKHIRGYYL